MDVGEVDRLTNQLDLQARAIAAVVGVVDIAVAGLSQTWAGEDLAVFTALWHRTHRPRAQSISDELLAWVTELRRQASQQESTSGAWGPGNVKAMARNMLAFAKAAEQWNQKSTTALPAGWHLLSGQELRGLGIDPSSLHRPGGTGLDASIFTDGHGHFVISYAGTAGSLNSRDWVEDGKGVVSPLLANASGQTQQAADLARELVAKVGVDNVELTGHSLGGRDAAVASVASGAHAVTFNAAGVTDEDLLYARDVSGRPVSFEGYLLGKATGGLTLHDPHDEARVTNYVIADDIVTDGQAIGSALLGTRTALGQTVVLPSETLNPFEAHHLDNFDGKV
jgi:hypothetical protein